MVHIDSKPAIHYHPKKHQTQNIIQQPDKLRPAAFIQLQQANRPNRKN